MVIQFNSDNNATQNKEQIDRLKSEVKDELSLYSKDITHIKAYLSDENGSKNGLHDKRCMLEARIANWQSVTVTSFGSTTELAVADALAKLNAAVQTTLGKLRSQ